MKKQGDKSSRFSKPVVQIAKISVALGVAVIIISLSVINGFKQAVTSKIVGFNGHITLSNYISDNPNEAIPIKKDAKTISLIKSLPNIKSIGYTATKSGILKTESDVEGILLKGVDENYDWDFLKKLIIQGQVPRYTNSESSKEVVVSRILCDRMNLKLSDKLVVYFITKKKDDSTTTMAYESRARTFTIKGIYESGFEEFDRKTIFVDLKHIQKLNYWDNDQVASYEIHQNNMDHLDENQAFLMENTDETINSNKVTETFEGLFKWMDLIDQNGVIIIWLMVIVAIFNMISAILILILEKVNAIGVLKALGAGDWMLRKIFIWQGFKIIIQQVFVGAAIAIGLCYLQNAFRFIPLDQKSYYVSYVPVTVDLGISALVTLGIMLVSMLCLFIPVLIISKIHPIKSIRFA